MGRPEPDGGTTPGRSGGPSPEASPSAPVTSPGWPGPEWKGCDPIAGGIAHQRFRGEEASPHVGTTDSQNGSVMHRIGRTIGRASVLAAAAALLLSACGSSGTSTSTTTPSFGTTTPSASASLAAASFPIPNGTFAATGTRQEALAKGFSNKEIDHYYGPDGKLPVTIVLDDGTFQAFVVGDDGVKELGSSGTYTATKTLWVATEESEACAAGCVETWRWSFDGKVLSLKLMPALSHDSLGAADLRGVRLVAEHDYKKVG